MRFFKFIDEENKSIYRYCERIIYVKGEEIVVKDADPDKTTQCSTGIHCICLDSKDSIDISNITFGPKIAFLEAKEEDILYYSANGKCRLRACVVTDIVNTGDLDLELLFGRGNFDFFYSCVSELTSYSLDQNKFNQLRKSAVDYWQGKRPEKEVDEVLLNLITKTVNYEEWMEKALIKGNELSDAFKMAIKHKKYFSPSLYKTFLRTSSLGEKIEWTKSFGRDVQIEKSLKDLFEIVAYARNFGGNDFLARKLIKDINVSQLQDITYLEEFALIYRTKEVEDYLLTYTTKPNVLCEYASKYKYNPAITKALINVCTEQKKSYCGLHYSSIEEINKYVERFSNKEEVIKLADLDINFLFTYYKATKKLTPHASELLEENTKYLESFYAIKSDSLFYRMLANSKNLSHILSFIKRFGFIPEFIKEITFDLNINSNQNYFCQDQEGVLLDIIIDNHNSEDISKFKELLFSKKVSIDTLIKYCYYLGYDEFVKNNIEPNFYSLNTIVYKMRDVYGYMPCIKQMFNDLLEKLNDEKQKERLIEEFEQIPSYYFKVAKRHFREILSALFPTESKLHKIYYSRGARKVASGTVFNNYFSAKKWCNIYRLGSYQFEIYRCTGDNFKLFENNSSINLLAIPDLRPNQIEDIFPQRGLLQVELEGSGILHNIKIINKELR